MNVAQMGAVFREKLNMNIIMEASVEGCAIFLDLTSVQVLFMSVRPLSRVRKNEFLPVLQPAESW